MLRVEKRNGKTVEFEGNKIEVAISKAMKETDKGLDEALARKIGQDAFVEFSTLGTVSIEQIQDFVEIELMKYIKEKQKNYLIHGWKNAKN